MATTEQLLEYFFQTCQELREENKLLKAQNLDLQNELQKGMSYTLVSEGAGNTNSTIIPLSFGCYIHEHDCFYEGIDGTMHPVGKGVPIWSGKLKAFYIEFLGKKYKVTHYKP